MAWVTGTANSHTDLLARLRDFLTANPALVAAGQQWQVIGGVASGAIPTNGFVSLKGQGLAGTDEILLSLQAYTSVADQHYNISLRGHTAYNPAQPSVDPPGANSPWASVLLVNSPFQYWLIGNGRCFKVITRINGRYDAMYGGFILPVHLPDDWSYPLFVGGSYRGQAAAASLSSGAHSNFWRPNADSQANGAQSCAHLFSPIQAWVPIRNTYSDAEYMTETGRLSLPWSTIADFKVRRQLDGNAQLERSQLVAIGYQRGTPDVGLPVSEVPEGGQFLGSHDGALFTPSAGAAAEQLVTYAGVQHLLIPNVWRTDDAQFAAFALE